MSLSDDIRSWSREVVEVPNPSLPNNLPACPYAAKAWADNRVEVWEAQNPLRAAVRASLRFPEDKDLIIVASTALPDLEEFETAIETLNDRYLNRDMFLMGFHPDYGAEDQELDFLYEHDWESAVEEDYCMIFVQRLSQVVSYSERLERLGYYTAFPPEEFQQLVVERRRRFRDGNEASRNEERR